jgi:uncharacterized radical SAM protein YgiQ
MEYDIIFISGEGYFDHPLSGIALLKRLLEKHNYKVGVISKPKNEKDITKLGRPKLFFGISSGSMDSMIRNYNALNRKRELDQNINYKQEVPDRAVIVYSNWVRKKFKSSKIVIGGVEATLRRFTHFDYWGNNLRKSIILESRANILAYGNAEKQILEIAKRIKNNESLNGIKGTCIKSKELPSNFICLPSHEEVINSKHKFCDMQNLLTNYENIAQKTNDFYILQYIYPTYTSKDLDEYYELPFKREVPKNLKGFEFSMVTHRGCIGNCNFCALRLTGGDKIISRSIESIIREANYIKTLPHFKGNIDDLGGPSANMYGMDCNLCKNDCINCSKLNKSHNQLIILLRKLRAIKGIKNVFVRSGVRYDLVTPEYIKEIAKYHTSGRLKIAPEHINEEVLELMNKNKGNLDKFISDFKKLNCKELSFYFITAHPGSTIAHAKELKEKIKQLKNAESVQIFTPTPMTMSTCMYYTGLNPKTKKPIHVPRTFKEKKEQKRILNLRPTYKKFKNKKSNYTH